MKYLMPILILCVCSGCATRKPAKPESAAAIPGTALSRRSMPSVRTLETVKAYPVGRYTNPNYPAEMHERHTVYRREQSPDWNYLPDPPYALPLGPTIANSNPSASYHVQAEREINAQQQRFAEVLQEQNRVLKKRIDAMQQDAAKIPGLEQEIDRLKKQFDAMPASPATPSQPEPEAAPEGDDAFSSVEPPLPVADETVESQAFLITQMCLNDGLAAEFESLERRKRVALFTASYSRRLTKNTP